MANDTFDFSEVVDSFEMTEQEDSTTPIEEAPDAFPAFNEEPEAMDIFEKIAKGEKGDKGDPGENFKILGVVESVEDLPENPEVGDAWIVGLASNRNCYMFLNDAWTNIGSITEGIDGVSPTVQTESITGGHRVTITDEAHPTGQSFDVMDGVSAPIYYGVCSSSATSSNKNVTIADFVLTTGVTVYVKFTERQAAFSNETLTLNVSRTGHIPIVVKGQNPDENTAWNAGEIVSFTYDGTSWNMIACVRNVYYGDCYTDADVQIKSMSIPSMSGTTILNGTILFVHFHSENTTNVPKLKINGGTEYGIFTSSITTIGQVTYTFNVEASGDPAISWRAGRVVILLKITDGWLIVSNDGYASTSTGGLMSAADKAKLNSALVQADLLDLIYPVGSIYMSVNNVSPATLFGGTWEQIEDMFLLAAGQTYAAGTQGGHADAIVPYHTHTTENGGAFTFTVKAIGRASGAYQVVANSGVTDAVSGASQRYVTSNDGTTTGTDVQDRIVHSGHKHTVNYAGTSGNVNGANMPPYVAVYVWKRVQDTVEEGNE